MEEDWLDQLDEDIKRIPELRILEDVRAREHVMSSLVLLFLKIWMRFVLDTGIKMEISPPSEEVAMYHGKNNWSLNQDFNFSALDEISLTNRQNRIHALKAETFTIHGRDHVRIAFSLEEERVKGQPVMVSYSVYSAEAKDFSIEDAVTKLKPALGKWFLSIVENEPSILWNFCKEKYELVGV
jgi:hypothetical protein